MSASVEPDRCGVIVAGTLANDSNCDPSSETTAVILHNSEAEHLLQFLPQISTPSKRTCHSNNRSNHIHFAKVLLTSSSSSSFSAFVVRLLRELNIGALQERLECDRQQLTRSLTAYWPHGPVNVVFFYIALFFCSLLHQPADVVTHGCRVFIDKTFCNVMCVCVLVGSMVSWHVTEQETLWS